MLVAETASPLVTVLIALVGGGGLAGALVALLKLRPEANSAAVIQAQGAMETMQELNDRLIEALQRERDRADKAETERDQLRKMNKQLTEVISGMRIMEDDDHFPPSPATPS